MVKRWKNQRFKDHLCPLSLTRTEMVLETLVISSLNHLTWLVTREYFIIQCRRESYKSYNVNVVCHQQPTHNDFTAVSSSDLTQFIFQRYPVWISAMLLDIMTEVFYNELHLLRQMVEQYIEINQHSLVPHLFQHTNHDHHAISFIIT
jgi:hypothetical protein